jgi:PAS domain S-box-containing protein
MEKTDIMIIDRLVEIQNKANELTKDEDIAGVCFQALISVPGINACGVCLGETFIKAGELNNEMCTECKAKRINTGKTKAIPKDFTCELDKLSNIQVISLDTAESRFGFLVCDINQPALFELYRPYIINFAKFTAFILENRMLKASLKEACDNINTEVEKRVEEVQQEGEKEIRRRPDVAHSPDTDIESLELSDIIDSEKIQNMMDEFYKLTNIGIGIIDLHGKVLVGTGWQDICTKFHRVNPESCRYCTESDLQLSTNVPVGTFKLYKCKNNMWDMATPIMIGDRHVGNIFLGQFLFDDETPDYDVFIRQASHFGFNEQEYISALEKIPRWSHDKVNAAMSFYTSFAGMIGNLSYSNIKLATALEERKRVEEVLKRLNRELRAISNCNQTLLRAYEEQPLLNEICRIICEEAGYRMAWVGYAGADDAKTVKPVAWAGTDNGYLGKANITWADTERGRGPTGTAIRTGETVYIQDFSSDTRMHPWYQDALQRGYRSSIAVPLKDENAGTFGALNIYSSEPDAFTPEEIRLLGELAGDMAFGISTIRNRAARLKAEMALLESEQKYRQIFNNVLDGIYLLEVTSDGHFRTIDVNPALEQVTGIPRTLSVGKTQEEIVPEEVARVVNQKYQKCVAMKQPVEEEVELELPSGRHFFHSTLIPTLDENGNVYRIIGISRDISEQKKAEGALHRLNRELRAISNCNQVLLRAEDELTLLQEICRIICEEAGYRMAWVGYAGTDVEKKVQPVVWAGVEEGYLENAQITWDETERGFGPAGIAIREGISSGIHDFATDPIALPWRENALKHGYRSCIALPLKDEKATPFGALIIYSTEPNAFTRDEVRLLEELSGDLAFGIIALRTRTERQRTEEALRISEERFSKIFRLSPAAIIIFRVADNRIADVNDTFLKQSGYTREEVIGRTSLELQLYGDPADRNVILQKLDEQGSLENFEFKIRNKYGEIRTGLNTTIVMNLGREKHYLSLIQDITERKQAETELIKAKEKAEESDRLKTAFLCNMSHEIRTPMNAIIGFSEFLFDPAIPVDKKQHFSEIIKERSYDLLRIVEDILDTSKIEVGQMQIVETDVGLGSLMNELYEYYALKILQTKAGETLTLNLMLAEDLANILIKADGQRLKQILNNLLDNALKFTQKGSIEFGCKKVPDSTILFFVKDTGIGIPADKQEIVFDPFRQAEDMLSARQYGGTGLGLSIVKGLVTLMKGNVWLESQVDIGTTFYFTLPLKLSGKNGEYFPENNEVNPKLSWNTKTILIVEDDAPNAEYLKEVLSGKGLQILVAYSGKETFQIIKNNPVIDLILMDIRLPDMNGLDLTRIIKKNNPKVIVIAQTAYVSSSDMQDCLDAGCSDFVAKPINKQKLVSMIDYYLGKKR